MCVVKAHTESGDYVCLEFGEYQFHIDTKMNKHLYKECYLYRMKDGLRFTNNWFRIDQRMIKLVWVYDKTLKGSFFLPDSAILSEHHQGLRPSTTVQTFQKPPLTQTASTSLWRSYDLIDT